MKYFSRLTLAAVLVWAFLASTALAADWNTIQLNRALGRTVGRYVTTDNGIAMRIKFTGTVTLGLARVDVGTNGDMTFYGDDGATADSTVGATGVMDVSTAAYDTFGEVCDAVNLSSNWACILVDVLPSQSTNDTMTSTTFGAGTASTFMSANGQTLKYNTDDLDMISCSIGPEFTSTAEMTETNLLNRKSYADGSGTLGLYTNELLYMTATMTYNTGVVSIKVYAVEEKKGKSAGATEVLLWQTPGGASTAAGTIPILPKQAPIRAPAGWRLVIEYIDASSATCAAASIQVFGLSYRQTP